MNKVVADVESGLKRIRTVTCPLNATRLHTSTPCELIGACADCHAAGCMCCQEVITRHSGLKRIRTVTCPLNATRLHTSTPCELIGACADCHAAGCMCCQEVITRHSRHNGRIHVVLVGEDLGF